MYLFFFAKKKNGVLSVNSLCCFILVRECVINIFSLYFFVVWVGTETSNGITRFYLVHLVHVFKNWKLLFENICGNTCGWKNTWKYEKYCLKTKNSCLKTQTKHPIINIASSFKEGGKPGCSHSGPQCYSCWHRDGLAWRDSSLRVWCNPNGCCVIVVFCFFLFCLFYGSGSQKKKKDSLFLLLSGWPLAYANAEVSCNLK